MGLALKAHTLTGARCALHGPSQQRTQRKSVFDMCANLGRATMDSKRECPQCHYVFPRKKKHKSDDDALGAEAARLLLKDGVTAWTETYTIGRLTIPSMSLEEDRVAIEATGDGIDQRCAKCLELLRQKITLSVPDGHDVPERVKAAVGTECTVITGMMLMQLHAVPQTDGVVFRTRPDTHSRLACSVLFGRLRSSWGVRHSTLGLAVRARRLALKPPENKGCGGFC